MAELGNRENLKRLEGERIASARPLVRLFDQDGVPVLHLVNRVGRAGGLVGVGNDLFGYPTQYGAGTVWQVIGAPSSAYTVSWDEARADVGGESSAVTGVFVALALDGRRLLLFDRDRDPGAARPGAVGREQEEEAEDAQENSLGQPECQRGADERSRHTCGCDPSR
ncbi:MAG TPA: hypothetical protein VFL27_12930, partial [Candidatus Dormibacteraeota bacterium]|nr:hypothetical protein [Candidatus Dormibacteraeota bacterium]